MSTLLTRAGSAGLLFLSIALTVPELARGQASENPAESITWQNAMVPTGVDPLPAARGTAGTSPSGSFVYDLPIQLPKGRRDMQPTLTLRYDSAGPNGLLGPGWSLGGLPAIGRVNAGRGIRYDGFDDYAFIPGGWGSAGSIDSALVHTGSGRTYHQARDDGRRFEASAEKCGDAPCYWVMHDGKGTRWYFGGDPEHHLSGGDLNDGWPYFVRKPRATASGDPGIELWGLYRVEDEYGNGWRVTWRGPESGDIHQDYDRLLPERIEYTTHASQQVATHTVDFIYEWGGGATAMPGRTFVRLQEIKIQSDGNNVRCYRMFYDTSPASARKRLIEVDDRPACRWQDQLLTKFTWTDDPLPVWVDFADEDEHHLMVRSNAGSFGWLQNAPGPFSTHLADINGDGLTDIVRVGGTIEYALADLSGSGESGTGGGFAPIVLWHEHHPIPAEFPSNDYVSMVVDIDGDGADDVLMHTINSEMIQILAAFGVPGATGPAALTDMREVGRFLWPTHPGIIAINHMLVLPGDVNGDGRADVVVTDHYHPRVVRFMGTDALDAAGRKQGFVNGEGIATSWSAPSGAEHCLWSGAGYYEQTSDFCLMTAGAQLSDFDGDGRDDVVLLWNARHHDREIVPGRIRMARAFGMGGPIGDWTPFADDMEFTHQRVWYQVRTGDIDGDKRGDLVLSRVGRQGTYDGGFLWWGHDSTYLYGKEVLGALGPLTGGAALDVHIRATARYRSWGTEPFLRYNEFNTSLADLNGDGLDDLVQVYRGWDGTDLDVALSTPAGSWSSGNAQDPSHHVATTNDSVCDGSHSNRRWRQVFGDLNGDGNADLLMAHHGDCGRKMHAFHGRSVSNHTVLGASGMTSEQAIQNNAIQVRGQSGPIFGGAHLSTTHLADVNGDGRDDIITLAIYNDPPPNPVRIYHALSRPGLPDRIWHVSEGLGRTYTVEYGRAHEMVATVPTGGTARPIRHAPEPGASHGASVVGTPITAPRELVQRLIINTGRRLERQRYAYDNERWLRGEPGVRRPLGFETVWVIDEDTGQVRQTRYHHDPERAGYPAVITTWAPGAAANAAPGQPTPQYYPARIEERTYEVVSSYGGTRAVRLRETRTRDYRGDSSAPDALVRDVTRETHYDGFHHATEDTTCADGVCITRSTDYAHDPVGWKLGRVDNVRTHDGAHTHDWLRHYYRAGGRFYEVEQSERIRFDASSTAVCETMDCGPGRWIVVRQNVMYDAFGHVRYEEDALGGPTITTRDPAYRTHVAQVTNAVGHVTRQEFDAMGRLQYVTDPNGYRDEIRYDAAGRPKELLRGAAGGVIQQRWEYLDFGDVTKQRVLLHVKSSATDEGVVARHIDGAGQPYEWVEGSHGDGAIHRLTAHGTASPQPAEGYVLSVSHRTETEVRPYLCQPGAPWCDEPARLTTRSDARGRPVEVKRTSQRRLDQNTWWAVRTQPVAAYRYDYEGYPSNLAPQVGFEGRCETLLDPTRRTVSCFDERGNLVARGRGADGGPLLDATRYEYDAASRLTRVDLPGSDEVTFTWDSWGNRRSITDPQRGTVTWTYDDLGRVDTETNTLGNIIDYDYDAIGRTTEKRVRRGSQTVVIAYEYDNPGVPNSLGRLTRVSAPDLTMQILQFDAFGNPKFVAWTTPDHSQPFIYQHTFDWIGRETEKRFPDGKIQRNVFKPANGPLFEVFYDGVKLASFTSHDALGRVRSGSHGGTTTTRTWHPDERLESLLVTNKRWDHLIFQEYEWDDAGNLMSITDQRQLNASNSGTDESASFAYDDLHRVTNATGPWGTHTFAYDGRGSFTRRNNQSYQYWTSPSLQAIYMPDGALPGFYEERDRAGNRTQIWDYRRSRWQTYSYDAENRLTSANVDGRTITFAYDAAGARVRKSFDDGAGITVTWTLGSGDYEVRHHSSNPYYTAVTRHIDTPNGRIATITDGYTLPGQPTTNEVYAHRTDPMTGDTAYGTPGGTWFLHAGLLGTTLLVTDAAGNQVTRYVHAPFGAPQPVGTGWDTVTTRFTGKTWDAETRMFDFGVRYYDPWTATFLTADTVLPGDGHESQDFNRFAYAYGNPLRYVDPTGHKPATDPATTGRQPILPPDHPDHPDASAFRQNFARALGAAGTGLSLVDSTFTGLTMAADGGLLGSTGTAVLGEVGILFRGAGFILNYGSLALFALRGTADPSAIGPVDALGASANTLVVVGDLTEAFANLWFTHGNARLALIGSRTSAVGASFGAGLLAGTLLDEGLTLTLGRSLGATVYDHVHHANNRYVQDHTWSVGLSNTSYGSLGYLKDLCQRSRDVLTCQRYAARGGKAEHLNFR